MSSTVWSLYLKVAWCVLRKSQPKVSAHWKGRTVNVHVHSWLLSWIVVVNSVLAVVVLPFASMMV